MTAAGAAEPGGAGVGSTGRTMVTWTLSLLPALVGAVGVVAIVVGAVLSGVTDGRQGWPFTLLAALLVATTVVSGSSVGLYGALAIVAAGGLVVDGGPSTAELVALVSTLVVVHEVVRFSLDARRPSRFGSGVVAGHLARMVGVGAILVALALGLDAVDDRAPAADGWIPIGVAAAALPLFVLWVAAQLDRVARLRGVVARAAIGVAATAAIVALVMIGAQARTEVVSTAVDDVPATTVAPPTTQAPVTGVGEPSTTTVPSLWVAAIAVVVLAALVYLMLRRPEAVFDLDELAQPGEGSAFELGLAGLADSESEPVNVDEDVLARLLGDLHLDMATEPDPGRAIRFGYATIERRLAEAGLRRADHETEREYLVRAMPPLGGAAEAMTTLTGLFERARFGQDPVAEALRQQALVAIDDLLEAITSLDVGGRDRPRQGPGPGRRP